MLHRCGHVIIKPQVTYGEQVYYVQLNMFRFELAARSTAAESDFGLRVKRGGGNKGGPAKNLYAI